jgi:two-component system sensor histidine kinase/response regulator
MAAALGQSDLDNARLLAHTLKGVSAQVGALRIRDLAQSLEHAIERHESAETIGPQLREAGNHLGALVNTLGKRLPTGHAAPTSATTSTPPDTATLNAICGQLVQHLERDDFASGQLVDDHEGLLRALFGADFEPFANAVHDFDFGSALEQLKRAMAKQAIAP